MNSHTLLGILDILEDDTLEQVSRLEKKSLGNGRWVPQDDPRREQKRFVTLTEWMAFYKEIIKDTSLARAEIVRLEKAVRAMEDVVKLALPFEGSVEHYWRLLFAYRDTFERLREVLRPVLNGENDNTRFRRAHSAELRKFSELYHGKSNVFVAINYGDDDDITFIKQTLQDLEDSNPEAVKFHYASDKKWLPGLLENAMFYMMACSAGLAFFTRSNLSERAVEHNPNVCFEFGVMWGLGMGSRCGLIKYEKVQGFADMRGLIVEEYKNVKEIRALVYRFLLDNLDLTLKS